jgi:hypothetical protein
MPYTVTVSLTDLGGFIGTGPVLVGTFNTLTPSPATDTATATAVAPTTLTFTSATPPPPGAATLYVANSGPGAPGDLFRSGQVPGLPASPATLSGLSFPLASTTLSAAALTAMLSGVGTIPLTLPEDVVAAVEGLTLGAIIPLTGAITGIVPTLNPATAGTPGSVTITVTGFFNFQVSFLFTDTITFTGTLVLTPAPSGDASQPGRILSILNVPGTTSLFITTTGPSPTLVVAGTFLSLMAPQVGAILQPKIESAINETIDGLVAPGLASFGLLRSPTSVLSARRVRITASSLSLSLVLADLFGPATSPIPGKLHAAISPTPKIGTNLAYTVTVTNADTGAPVDQADVTLRNYTATGTVQTVGPLQSGPSGQVTFNVTLRPKITGNITHVYNPPTLSVSKNGFNPINRTLP